MWKFTTLFCLVFLLLIGAGCSSPSENQESEKDPPAETSTEDEQENSEENQPEKEDEQAENDKEAEATYEMNSGYAIISSLEEVPDFFPDIPIPEGAVMEGILESEVGGSKTITVMYKLNGTEIAGLGEEYNNFLEGSRFSSISYNDFEHTIKITGFDEDMNMLNMQLYVEESVISATLSFKIKMEE